MRVSKKYSIFLVLLLFPSFLFAGNNYYNYGGGVAGCTAPTKDSYATGADFDRGVIYAYNSASFTTTSAYTVVKVGVSLIKIGTPPTANVLVYLYDDAAGEPENLIGTSSTILSSADIATTYTTYYFDFAGVSLSTTTRYHIVIGPDLYTDTLNRIAWQSNDGGSPTEGMYRSSDAVTWTAVDTSMSAYYEAKSCN